MAFSFFTAFHTALQDPSSYFSFQKEMNLKAVEQVFFNSLAGTNVFDAVVLPEDLGSSATYDGQKSVRVRPLGIHDFIIPEPCSYKDPVKIKKILAMHPVAYPDSNSPLSAGNDTNPEHQAFGGGVVVECFFKDGPQSAGRLRGLTYRLKSSRSTASNLNLECLGVSSGGSGGDSKIPSEAQRAFEKGDYKQYEQPNEGETASGVLEAKTETAAKYVKESTRGNITTDKTSDGKKHSPSTKTYSGKVDAHKGKKLENGLLPADLIKQSTSATGAMGLFLVDVVDDFDRLARAFQEKFNQKLKLNDSYRSFNDQIRIKNEKMSEGKATEAATPGTSNHGWGLAFDFNTHYNGKSGFQSETYNWMLHNAPRFGFESPQVLRDGDPSIADEAWHIQWINKNKIWR